MKFFVVGPTYPYKGGISHFNTLLCENLRKEHSVTVISWKRRFPKLLYPVNQLDRESKEVIKTNALFILDYLNPFTWFKAFIKIKREKPDKVVFHWVTTAMTPPFLILFSLIKIFTKTKIILICHNIYPHEKRVFDKLCMRIIFNLADYLLVHSKSGVEEIRKITSTKKIINSFLPIFDIFSSKKPLTDIVSIKNKLGLRKNVILFFGIVRKYKGLIYLIKALPDVIKEINADLLIVGEFWDKKQRYIDLIHKLKVENNVKIIDRYIPNEEVEKYFQIADVVVLPYISGSQSAIIQIAYVFNKPVITTNIGGFSEVVIDGETGFVVPPKNYEELSQKILNFYKLKNRDNFVINIKNEKKKYSWENYIKLLIQT